MKTETAARMGDSRTLGSVVRSKFLDWVEGNDLATVAASVSKASLSCVLAASLFDTRYALEIAKEAVYFADFALPKTAAAFAAVYGWRVWYSAGRWLVLAPLRELSEHFAPDVSGMPSVRGIPVPELADFVFTEGTFAREALVSRFGVSRSVADFLLGGLEDVGVLVRGANNARVLDERYSRSDVVSILSNVERDGFQKLLRKDGENSYTTTPSMPEIVARSFPAEDEGFTVKALSA